MAIWNSCIITIVYPLNYLEFQRFLRQFVPADNLLRNSYFCLVGIRAPPIGSSFPENIFSFLNQFIIILICSPSQLKPALGIISSLF